MQSCIHRGKYNCKIKLKGHDPGVQCIEARDTGIQ